MNPNLRHRALGLSLVVLTAAMASGCSDDNDRAPDPVNPEPTAGPFSFRSNPPSAYVRIDRMGQPATGTALLSRAPGSAPADPTNPLNGNNNQRDAFNRGNPDRDDADFLPLMAATLLTIHVELAPVLRDLGLTTCSTGEGPATEIAQCAAQAAPVVSPDVMTLDLSQPDGWPNGRGFDDNVINRLLSAALLDLRVHPITLLESLPLNPPTNDADPEDTGSPPDFPYIRPRHPGSAV